MIDMSDIITDPDFMETFTVYRKTGTFGEGGYTTTEVAIDMAGPVIPANPDELAMVPEGDRLTGNNVFYSTAAIYRTRLEGTSDEILWNGDRYRVLHVWNRSGNGFYKALAARMAGN